MSFVICEFLGMPENVTNKQKIRRLYGDVVWKHTYGRGIVWAADTELLARRKELSIQTSMFRMSEKQRAQWRKYMWSGTDIQTLKAQSRQLVGAK